MGKALTDLFLLLLAAAWVAVFLPAVLRARRDTPLGTAERFRKRMELIAPRTSGDGRWIMVPANGTRRVAATRRRKSKRRERFLAVLLMLAPATLLAALLWSGVWWEIHVAALFSLAVYVAVLLEAKGRRRERAVKVRPIAPRLRSAEALEAERRARA